VSQSHSHIPNLEHRDKEKVEMFPDFLDFLLEEDSQNRGTVLTVDEAQNTSTDTLEELHAAERQCRLDRRRFKRQSQARMAIFEVICSSGQHLPSASFAVAHAPGRTQPKKRRVWPA
jgi:hypothetical protein